MGSQVPIQAGGRVTGRVGRYSLGMLNIGTREDSGSLSPATNFSVVRVKRDILRRSSIGLIATGRSNIEGGTANNQAYGVDGTFAFFANLAINTYWARTQTDGVAARTPAIARSSTTRAIATACRSSASWSATTSGRTSATSAAATFVCHRGSSGSARVRNRAASSGSSRGPPTWRTRRTAPGASRRATCAASSASSSRTATRFAASYGDTYEFLPRPVAHRRHHDSRWRLRLRDDARRLQLRPAADASQATCPSRRGEFYSGHKTTLSISQGRVNFTPQLSIEPTYLGNWVDVVEGSSTTHLIGSRVTYTVTPEMFVSALVQYNTGIDSVSANVRLRWEYRPGSELFVVLNEQRDTLSPRFPDLVNRAFIVKINRLVRF